MDRTGQLLDQRKYRLVRLVGEGGMGAVYEAVHVRIGRRCAVKFLHPEFAGDPTVAERFVREARAASAVGHKGIIDIYDVGVSPDGAPYLVMEYLEGRSLESLLAGGVRLPVAQVVEVVVQALGALAAAHRRGIIHRDVKPANLFVEQAAGAAATTKILDFGVSHMDLGLGPGGKLTRTGTALGTPFYMAPEQAGGLPDVDHRLDLYAVGVVLYECLTGRLPFQADNYNRLIIQICTEPFPRPREIVPSIPPALEAVVLKAMSRDRNARYRSADEMIEALVPFLPAKSRARLGVTVGGSDDPALAGTLPAAGMRVCPRCGRPAAQSFQHCPWDGERLVDASPSAQGPAPPSAGSGAPTAPARVSAVTSVPARPVRRRRLPMFVALAVVATAMVVGAVVLTRDGKPGAKSRMAAGPDAGADATIVAAAAASVPDVAAVNVVATDVAAVDVPAVVPAPAAAVETAPAPDAGPQPPEGSVLLAAGGATFPMGRDGATPAEGPAHEVTLRPFYLDRTEVTRERYRRCVDAGRCEAARGGGDDVSGDRAAWPVTGVTFVQAEAYCGWIGRRLPAEAEFEFAIRGVEGRLYPWGSVWKDGCSNSRAGAQGSPRPIGTSGECGATPEGVVDLLGNVWEFVSGPAEPYPGGAPLENAGAGKVLMRGHSYFNTDAKELTGTFRMWVGRTMQGPWLGFRCAADAP